MPRPESSSNPAKTFRAAVSMAPALLAALLEPWLLSACVSIGVGGDVPAQSEYLLHDAGATAARRAEPIVAALLIQALPADAAADTVAIA